MTPNRWPVLKIIIACLVSGIVGGLLSAWQCRGAESDCSIAALKYYSAEPVSLATWAHWINWLPGVVFGLLFAIVALKPSAGQRARRVLLYALVSAAAYLVAGLVFSAFLAYASSDEFSLIVWIWPGGFCAGLLGAAVLGVAANAVIRSPEAPGGAFSRAWLPAVVGGVAGVLFVFVCIQGEQHVSLAFPAAFSIWQIAVGLALAPRNAPPEKTEVQ